jgi:hypothetical protein
MTNKHQNQSEQMTGSEQLISYCGFYCGACPTFTSGKCEGCRGDSPKCAVGYKTCSVKPCCVENGFSTCADCTIYTSLKECKKYNPLSIRFGEWISNTSRGKAIELIREKGQTEFSTFMTAKNWVTIKTKDSFLNKKFGKKLNE